MRKLKGFTLVELIIVMAILAILMAALMNMMKPIRATYVDSTYYEAERNTQSGIAQYITESVRYATNIGIYTDGKSVTGETPVSSISSVRNAIDHFKDKTGVTDESKINVITIDNKTAYTFNNAKYYGRIIRTKGPGSTGSYTTDAAVGNNKEARLALGAAYYGDNTYSINLTSTTTGIKVQVSSLLSDSLKSKTKQSDNDLTITDVSGKKMVTTEAEAVCYNVTSVSAPGAFITTFADTTTTAGKNTYIVFTLPE